MFAVMMTMMDCYMILLCGCYSMKLRIKKLEQRVDELDRITSCHC